MMTRARNLTCLDPKPICRSYTISGDLAEHLDLAMSSSDEVLASNLPAKYRLVDYRLISMSLIYHDNEHYILDNAGYIAAYVSAMGGKPVVHQYGWDQLICWSWPQTKAAELLRSSLGLRRYSLFCRRFNGSWQFNHNGQLLLVRKGDGDD